MKNGLDVETVMDSLTRLQGLHQDLIAFTHTRLANIDRLWQELDASIQEFRDLLDKSVPDAGVKISVTNGEPPKLELFSLLN